MRMGRRLPTPVLRHGITEIQNAIKKKVKEIGKNFQPKMSGNRRNRKIYGS